MRTSQVKSKHKDARGRKEIDDLTDTLKIPIIVPNKYFVKCWTIVTIANKEDP